MNDLENPHDISSEILIDVLNFFSNRHQTLIDYGFAEDNAKQIIMDAKNLFMIEFDTLMFSCRKEKGIITNDKCVPMLCQVNAQHVQSIH